MLIVALSLALAWGIRGQHGHERGAAIVGAMAGLSIAAVTGGPRWIGAAVIGSVTFAIGGALSYGRFIQLAYEGSFHASASLALIGFAWGVLGSLGLGLGLALPKYRLWERGIVAGSLLFLWFVVDRLLWGHLKGPQDLQTRELMATILLGCWVFLCAYVRAWRQDRTSLRLAIFGAIGFSLGFPLAAWVQGIGHATGVPVDWWKVSEHLIGLCGGIALGIATRRSEPTWFLPLAVKPLERWFAVVWLLWLLPLWVLSNNLDYWIVERAVLPPLTSTVVWRGGFLILLWLILWGWMEIRRGRTFVTSWMPRHLRKIFLTFLWLTTVIAASKTLAVGTWSPTPSIFFILAVLITWLLRRSQS
jgi:hypothetical protein